MKEILLAVFAIFVAMPSCATDRFVGELLLGNSDQKLNVSAKSISSSGAAESGLVLDGGARSYGVQAGYQFNNYFAVELGYHQYGEFSSLVSNVVRVTFDSSSMNFGVKGILPLSEAYSLTARLGVANWDLNTKSNVHLLNSDINSIKGHDNDIYYGVGGEYTFNKNYFIGLAYSILTMRWDTREEFQGGVFSVDYKYRVNNISLSVGVFF